MAVVHVEDNWQTKRRSVLERVAFLWNSELLSDVKFVVSAVSVSNGESKTTVIPAHKFVLAISSPVFYAMFYGQMAETTDSIELPDCEYESLLEFFRFLYIDEVKLTGSNVIHILYLAKKYMVPSLADKCATYLRANLEASNVFAILPHAQKFEYKDLEDQCWKVIEIYTEEAVTSDEFVTLERSLVESVVKRECLHMKEVELFKAVDRWATKESEKQGINLVDKEKRRIVGEEIVKAIRFPLMSETEFISVVAKCNILTEKETAHMLKYYNNALTSPLTFVKARRVKSIAEVKQCHRFEGNVAPRYLSWTYTRGIDDRLCFTVSKDILLYGVQHFGRDACSYTVSLEIQMNSSCIVKQSGSYFSQRKYHDRGNKLKYYMYYGFDVMFDNPVCLTPNNQYEIVSLIKGDGTCYGHAGIRTVHCCGVDFTFSDSPDKTSNNGTGVASGQFSAILFYM